MATNAPIADGLDESKLHFVDVDGIPTRYYEDGTGEPLLLFSGGQFGSYYSLDAFSLNYPALARHFRVFGVDKLGMGHTGNPKRDADYTFEAVLAHMVGFMEALGIRGAHVCGHSRGALLATRIVLDYPDLARTLILLDTATTSPPDPRFPEGDFYRNIDRRRPPGPPTAESVRMEPDEQAYDRSHITDDFVNRMVAIARLPKMPEAKERVTRLADSQWMPSLVRARDEALARIDEAGVGKPTLMFWGVNDKSAPLPLGLNLYQRITAKTPRAEMHIVNQAGHYAFREQADALNRLLPAFCLR
jgi:2-hydroxy-6-oxo-6-(2'-carboxyphenyl)-hexa-2,4-dienoate hydrolase